MMPPVGKRELWLVGILAFFVVNAVVGFHFYERGKYTVALKATEDSLTVVKKEKAVIQKQRDSIGKELVAAAARTAQTRTVYVHDKADTEIKGDSAFDSKGVFIQVLDPRISGRIRSADAHVTSLEDELATAKVGLKIDTVLIAKQSQENGLNERIAGMVKGSRVSKGFQVGGGYCATGQGSSPCIYAGYGFSVRFP